MSRRHSPGPRRARRDGSDVQNSRTELPDVRARHVRPVPRPGQVRRRADDGGRIAHRGHVPQSLPRVSRGETRFRAPARVRVRAGGDVFPRRAVRRAPRVLLARRRRVARRTVGDANSAPEYVSRPNASARVHPLDAPFAPSPINTVSFLVNVLTQTATAAVNYAGAPHKRAARAETRRCSIPCSRRTSRSPRYSPKCGPRSTRR